jgi:hypothetical protein
VEVTVIEMKKSAQDSPPEFCNLNGHQIEHSEGEQKSEPAALASRKRGGRLSLGKRYWKWWF